LTYLDHLLGPAVAEVAVEVDWDDASKSTTIYLYNLLRELLDIIRTARPILKGKERNKRGKESCITSRANWNVLDPS